MDLRTYPITHAALLASIVLGVLSVGGCGSTPTPTTSTVAPGGSSTASPGAAAPGVAAPTAGTPASAAPGATGTEGAAAGGAGGTASTDGSAASGGATDSSPNGVNAGSGGQAATNGASDDLDLSLALGGLAVAAGAGGLLVRWRSFG
jgi:hypothetical protein